jgi:hypothetical protein
MRTFRTLLAVTMAFAAVTSARAESKARTHDGFHFQLTGGLGFYGVSGSAPANQDFSGMTIPGSLLIGGTLLEHLAFGGGLYLDYAPSPKYEWNGTEMKNVISSQMILGIGVYGDYYLDPQKNGLHFQVFGGWGGLETSFQGNVGGSDPTGLLLAAGAGYEWWLTDEWSGGFMARLVYAPLDLNGTKFKTFEPAIVGTLTWH